MAKLSLYCPVCGKSHSTVAAVMKCKANFMKTNEYIGNLQRHEISKSIVQVYGRLAEMISQLSSVK